MIKTLDRGTQNLVDDLLAKPQSFTRDELIARARRFYYHDYKSPYVVPECVLLKHLTRAGFPDLAERVLEDRYSQRGTGESQKWVEQTDEGRQCDERLQDPQMQEALSAIETVAASPRLAADSLAFLRKCISHREFSDQIFSDAKVRDPRKAN